MFRQAILCSVGALALAGCNSIEPVAFNPAANQSAITRDGAPAIVSKKANSIVMISPVNRGEPKYDRVAYVVAITNLSKKPIDFHESDVTATQVGADGGSTSLPVITFEQLTNEENQRRVAAAIVVGLAAGANSYAAASAGYGHAYGTVTTPYGTGSYNATYYNPGAAAAASTNAAVTNAAMINNTIAVGQQNMANLERNVLKDNTIMPGEWVGGQVQISPPVASGSTKKYTVVVTVGGERHSFDIAQGQPNG